MPASPPQSKRDQNGERFPQRVKRWVPDRGLEPPNVVKGDWVREPTGRPATFREYASDAPRGCVHRHPEEGPRRWGGVIMLSHETL